MPKAIVVAQDPVTGTDIHKVSGKDVTVAVYAGVGSYAYKGAITSGLSDLVTIAGQPVALVTSHSSLPPAETAPGGGHTGPKGDPKKYDPKAPAPNAATLQILDKPLGDGVPGPAAGSALLTIGGVKVLLDGDPIATCSASPATPGDSTVAATGQTFVTCTD